MNIFQCEKTDSGVGEIRETEAIYALSHFDAKIIHIALREYRKLLKRRIGTNDKFNFEERIEDVKYLIELFRSTLGEAKVAHEE